MKRKVTTSARWKKLAELPELTIEAGIFEEQGSEVKQVEEGSSDLKLIDVANIHEFGAGDIPERSFVRAWFDENEDRIKQVLLKRLTANGPDKLEKSLEQVALWIQADMRKRVRKRIPPPLKPETIKRKGSSTPLVDTGQLVAAILAKVSAK